MTLTNEQIEQILANAPTDGFDIDSKTIESLYREILDLRKRVQELEAQVPKWGSVDDKLPDPETPVLAIVSGYDGILTLERRWEHCNPMIESYYEDFLYWDWVDNDGQDFEGLVHYWMPIPLPPKGQEHE